MHIEHVAIWTNHLERLKQFYETYFAAVAGPKYTNPRRFFESYFLVFAAGARLEIMTRSRLIEAVPSSEPITGYAHLAIALGSTEHVDRLTERLRTDGYTVVSPPRWTGDGYYESVVLDPDGNQIELTQ